MYPVALLGQIILMLQAPVTDSAAPAEPVTAAVVAPNMPGEAAPATDSARIAIPEEELAGIDEPQESVKAGNWAASEGARTGAALAVVLGFYRPDFDAVNAIAESLNFPGGFGGGALFMSGLRGYGYIGPHFRIGGMAISGDGSVIDPGAEFNRLLELSVDQGGITLEGVYAGKRFEVYGGGMVGIGSYELTYSQVDLRGGRPAWDELLDTYSGTPNTSTFSKRFSAGYTAVQPWVGMKYKILPWFALDGNIGYHWGRIGKGDWVFSDEGGFGIRNSPSLDVGGLTGALEVTFGFFPY